jgi:hypothetical protein
MVLLQLTVQYAIPYHADELPVNRLRIHAAADLKTAPVINSDDPDQEAYQFEVEMTGYYSDPVEDPEQRTNAAVRADMTKTTTQLCFAQTSQRLFTSILGSPNLRVNNSKLFIEGEYTFAFEATHNHSFIEINHVSFNSTNKTKASATKGPRTAQDSARKRVTKSPNFQAGPASSSRAPITPQQGARAGNQSSSVASSSRTPYAGSSVQPTPSTTRTLDQPPPPELGSREFIEIDADDDEEIPITPSQPKKGTRPAKASASGSTVRRGKRQKKATPKAAGLHASIVEEAEEAGFGSFDGGSDGEEYHTS